MVNDVHSRRECYSKGLIANLRLKAFHNLHVLLSCKGNRGFLIGFSMLYSQPQKFYEQILIQQFYIGEFV